MTALDTNVLVRFLVEDDPEQCKKAARFIQQATRREEELLLTQVVVCETVWVLGTSYRFTRSEISSALHDLFRARQIVLEEGDSVRTALASYRNGKGDFADYLLRERSRDLGAGSVVTFDRALLGEEGVVAP